VYSPVYSNIVPNVPCLPFKDNLPLTSRWPTNSPTIQLVMHLRKEICLCTGDKRWRLSLHWHNPEEVRRCMLHYIKDQILELVKLSLLVYC